MNKRELNRLIEQAAAGRNYPARNRWSAGYSGEARNNMGGSAVRSERRKLDTLLSCESATVNADGQRSSREATVWYVSHFNAINNLKD